jgi:hypothetical protein
MSNTTKNNRTAEANAFTTGLSSLTDTSFLLATQTVPKTALVQVCSTYLAAVAATAAAKAEVQTCLAAERSALLAFTSNRALMKTFLEARYGKGSPELLKFGFTPAKPRKVSVKAMAAGIEQGKLTRAERHTMGKKQRLEIKPVAPAATTGTTPTKA